MAGGWGTNEAPTAAAESLMVLLVVFVGVGVFSLPLLKGSIPSFLGNSKTPTLQLARFLR